MSKPVNKTLIGAFVVGALALAIAGVVVFGSGKFLAKTKHSVMFFEGSVKGLNIGSPVVIRGVKIGEVTDINLIYNAEDQSALVSVIIETDPEKITVVGLGGRPDPQVLIKKGFRGQLQLQSFVTGQLMVSLDFHPETPAKLYGLNKKYPEVPTIPTATEQLAKTLENLPLEDMVKKLDSMIAGLNTLVNSPDLKANFRNLNEALDQVEKLAQHFNNEVVPSIRAAVDTAGKSMAEVAPNINKTLESASAAMDAAHAALSEMKDFTAQSGQMGYEMSSAIRELSDAARSMRLLGDYLERHPESLLRGKKENKGE